MVEWVSRLESEGSGGFGVAKLVEVCCKKGID